MTDHVLTIVAVLAGLGFVLWAGGTWNHLIRLRNQVEHAFAGIDVLLKQRHDELPALVDACRGAMRHERATLERVTALRATLASAGAIGTGGTAALSVLELPQRVALENELTSCLGQVFARVEAYPELRSTGNVQALRERITELENHIADRRELYNDAVTAFNDAVAQIPSCWFARLLRYRALDWLAAPSARQAPAPADLALA